MSENYLKEGQVRVGWLYPGEVDKEEGIPATLVRKNKRIQLFVQVKSYQDSSPAAGWGTRNIISFSDDLQYEKYQYDVPENMYFIDDIGHILLIGCKYSGSRDSIISAFAGYGGILKKISVDTAVFSTRVYNTDAFNGYKTEIENLSQWLQMNTLSLEPEFYEDGLGQYVKSVSTKASSDEEISVDDSIGLKFKSGFKVKSNKLSTQIIYKSSDSVETHYEKSISFNEAMKKHSVIRDLLMVSSWSDHQFISISVSNDKEMNKWVEAISVSWETVETIDVEDKEFLFVYQDIKDSGVRRWLEIHDQYSRAISPILSTIRWNDSPIENILFNLCAGAEALGRYIAHDFPDKSFESNGRAYLQGALQNIINQIPKGILPYVKSGEGNQGGKVVNNLPEWKEKINNSYNSVKHYGGEEVDYDEVFEAIDLLKIILLSWIGTQLGVPAPVLKDRLNKYEMYLPELTRSGYKKEKPKETPGV